MVVRARLFWCRWKLLFLAQFSILLVAIICGIVIFPDQNTKMQTINILDIFYNNLVVGYSLVIYGCFTGGILSLVIIISNGMHIGIGIKAVLKYHGLIIFIKSILPHFFLELTGICCFGCLGLYPGYLLINYFRGRENCYDSIFFDISFIAFTGASLLLLAACIEGDF